jgi:hypothetical protein
LMYGNSWKTINQKFSQIELIFRSEIDLSTWKKRIKILKPILGCL